MIDAPPESVALADRLKAATSDMHRRVERSAFMAGLLRGDIDRPRYVALLYNLQPLYGTMEAALVRHAAQPALAAVALPELFRAAALAADLEWLAPSQSAPATQAPATPLLPATQRYVERLRELEAGQPQLLVAHAYVRYLGDLYGGQALRAVVARALGLEGAAGTRFYDFGDGPSRRRLRQRFRDGLDRVQQCTPDTEAIVAEAVSAFERHEQLFAQLQASA